ncbi:MAG: alpha/beta hydrolase [Sedimentisphaerales bacterium]|nr:alpha/beta hydrolase [Sedimentisphaerales bacterium]
MMERCLITRGIIYLVMAVLTFSYAVAPAGEVVPLWEDKIPGALGSKEKDVPVLMLYIPAPDKATGAAVVVCPGGGYGHLAMDHEGEQIGQWLESIGVAAFVLRYRLPANGYRHPIPLLDAQRAIRTVRFNAAKWNIQPDKIGIMGFSAGGHLASSAGTHFNNPVVLEGTQSDGIDGVSCRPDFMILIYPVISMQPEITHGGSRDNLLGKDPSAELVDLMSNEKQVTKQTPPTFLVHASDDKAVLPENSIRFYQALLKAGVPAEMHMYLKGGHGFGTRASAGRASQWPMPAEGWMRQMKFLPTD